MPQLPGEWLRRLQLHGRMPSVPAQAGDACNEKLLALGMGCGIMSASARMNSRQSDGDNSIGCTHSALTVTTILADSQMKR